MSTGFVLWLDKKALASADGGRVGPKAAGLCTLARLGMRVPPCFFLTTAAFREHLKTNDLNAAIASCLDGLLKQLDAGPTVLERIREKITSAPLSPGVTEQVGIAYEKLDATTVSVRSSATAEDLPGHSFAGQYETVLNVTSLEDCLDAIKRCWASLWTERAYEYRRRNGIDHGQVEMAVIVQRQIDPEAAGVAFSLDPITGSRSRIVIESCEGLGDTLVSGRVQPDRLVLRKKNLALIHWDAPDGVRRPTLDDPAVASRPSLELKTATRLARHIRKIEKRLGGPQDIEWAVSDGTIWFLQTRPITVVPPQKSWEDRQVWTNSNTGEVMPDVTTPATWSMIELLFYPLFRSVFKLLGADPREHPFAGLVAGRVYFNVNTGLAAGRPFGAAGSQGMSQAGTILGGDQDRMYALGKIDIPDEDLPDLGFRWPKYILSWPRLLCDLIRHSPKRAAQARARLRARSEATRALDTDPMGNAELAEIHISGLWDMIPDVDLLFLISGAVAPLVLGRALLKWLGETDDTVMYRLFAAQGGMADTEAGLAMWALAKRAHADEATREALLEAGPWDEVRERLVLTEHGREFVAAWDRFMAEHGHHCRGELEFFNPRWSETPDYVLGLVRNYVCSVPRMDPVEHRRRLISQRDELAGECRRRLRNPIKRFLFTWSLRGTCQLLIDRENWKDEVVRLVAAGRNFLLALGDRLSREGILSERDDIFFLKLDEIESVARRIEDFDVKQRIAMRRAEYEKNCSITPPPVVIGRFDPDKYVAPPVDETARVLNGIAVSPGIVTGRARVILRTDDHQHVEAGEILVAPFTDPAWTPYFLPAAAVVMDMGGVLSHGSIIAREYGIPAVVNVGPASKIIKTGQRIRVDGDRGTVTILDES
jgi:pyruvate,water dikinase